MMTRDVGVICNDEVKTHALKMTKDWATLSHHKQLQCAYLQFYEEKMQFFTGLGYLIGRC